MEPEMEYLQKVVNPILEPLVVDLLIHRPTSPAEFIHGWIEKNCLHKHSAGTSGVTDSKIVDAISQAIIGENSPEKPEPRKRSVSLGFSYHFIIGQPRVQ
jgi:hypothetical protein